MSSSNVITITLVNNNDDDNNNNGQSETITIDPIATTIGELLEWSKALFGYPDTITNVTYINDGKQISVNTTTASSS